MPGTSRRVRRLEKEAILRAKECEYTRQQSDSLLSKFNIKLDDIEDEDTERHRRHVTTRPIRQIQQEIDYPVETLDKITERIQLEVKRRQLAAASAPSTGAGAASTSTTRNYHTSLSSSSKDDRSTRESGFYSKYASSKRESGSKLH